MADTRTPRERVTIEDLLLLDFLGEKAYDAHKKRLALKAKRKKPKGSKKVSG